MRTGETKNQSPGGGGGALAAGGDGTLAAGGDGTLAATDVVLCSLSDAVDACWVKSFIVWS